MEDIREIVNREDWQQLRKSLVGTWKRNQVENVGKLRSWLEQCNWGDRELRIMHNYLTGSGFRIGIISHPEIDMLLEEVRNERRKRWTK